MLNNHSAGYGKQIVHALSALLTKDYGKGFTIMRQQSALNLMLSMNFASCLNVKFQNFLNFYLMKIERD